MCKDCGCGEDNGVVTKVFTVPGMMCNNCKETVEGATLGLDGVLSSEVDLPNKTATVSLIQQRYLLKRLQQLLNELDLM